MDGHSALPAAGVWGALLRGVGCRVLGAWGLMVWGLDAWCLGLDGVGLGCRVLCFGVWDAWCLGFNGVWLGCMVLGVWGVVCGGVGCGVWGCGLRGVGRGQGLHPDTQPPEKIFFLCKPRPIKTLTMGNLTDGDHGRWKCLRPQPRRARD